MFLRKVSRICTLGSVFRAMSVMFRPVTSASEAIRLAPTNSQGRTNERHSPPKNSRFHERVQVTGGILYLEPITLSPRQRPA